MPSVKGIPGPYRFFFYSFDCLEPEHIHVKRENMVSNEPLISAVEVSDASIIAHLTDGRMISVPLAWSWRLSDATPEQRQNYEIIGRGQGIHWPDVDEDISAVGMLTGIPARPPRSLSKSRPVRRRGAASASIQ
jgi:hypothetical protein